MELRTSILSNAHRRNTNYIKRSQKNLKFFLRIAEKYKFCQKAWGGGGEKAWILWKDWGEKKKKLLKDCRKTRISSNDQGKKTLILSRDWGKNRMNHKEYEFRQRIWEIDKISHLGKNLKECYVGMICSLADY